MNNDGIFTINLSNVGTLMFATFVLIVGYFLKDKIKFLNKFCIPAPVIGGFLFMILNTLFYFTNTIKINFNVEFQSIFMLAFFTTVGLGASLSLLKSGGKLLFIYWLICGGVAFLQCSVGVGVSSLVGLDAAYGLIAGPASLIGGHGGAAAYGQSIIELGYDRGVIVGFAAATYGLIVGGLIGGPVGRILIERYNLKPEEQVKSTKTFKDVEFESAKDLTFIVIIKNLFVIFLCMSLGGYLSSKFSQALGISLSLPSYVGAMFVAVIARNLNTKIKAYEFDHKFVSKLGEVFLGIFLAMALMSTKLWQLSSIALPLLMVLIAQTIMLISIGSIVVFRVLGKNYDAAVMVSGLLGHGLGATPTAMVNMSAINERYGFSYKAMMIVPIVGAFLVDILYHPIMIAFLEKFA